jgi:hypothetical protein
MVDILEAAVAATAVVAVARAAVAAMEVATPTAMEAGAMLTVMEAVAKGVAAATTMVHHAPSARSATR